MAPSGKGSSEDAPHGAVFSVSGPVVVAENMIGCAMYELVRYHNQLMTLVLADALIVPSRT